MFLQNYPLPIDRQTIKDSSQFIVMDTELNEKFPSGVVLMTIAESGFPKTVGSTLVPSLSMTGFL